MNAPRQPVPDPPRPEHAIEGPVWRNISGIWRPLFGGFQDRGVSIEWHEFSSETPLDWAKSFHPASLEICLNFSGSAQVHAAPFAPEEVALYTTAQTRPEAVRPDGHLHRFLTVELSADYLRTQFERVMGGLRPEIRAFVENPEHTEATMEILPMTARLLAHRLHLVDPPVTRGAEEIWYQSQVLEIAAQVLFQPDAPSELFCERHRRVNRDRVERVRFLLERDHENPPTLEMLAAEVACSPFYLSRLFAQEAGVSIPKYLRRTRVRKAAELLAEGRHNVTEAAMAVGYTSLSAFTRAFADEMGCAPSRYGAGG